MDTHPAYAPPSLATARSRIAILLAAFEQATGLPPTLVGKLARGEPKFPRSFQEVDFGFRSYDIVVSRLSRLWPEGVAWPEAVPRQAPADIGPEGVGVKQLSPEQIPFDVAADYFRRMRERADRLSALKTEMERLGTAPATAPAFAAA